MVEDLIEQLLTGNERHCESLTPGAFDDCRDGQHPPVVSVCCSDSRVSQQGMWDANDPEDLFTPSNIGNRVSDRVDGENVLDGSVAYPVAYTDTDVVAVVGHTGCGAVGAAMDAVLEGTFPDDPGVRADVEELVPIVERGLEDPDVAPDGTATENLHDRLVEHNVHEQVAFALDSETVEKGGADVYGFVYDLHRTYGDQDGATSLVNANGKRDTDVLREAAGTHADHVHTLLD